MSRLSHSKLLQLKRFNTPTIYNGWEQITRRDPAKDGFNLEVCTDFMPQMGPMVGYAVTVVIEPSNPQHKQNNPDAREVYYRYISSIEEPKIVVIQDLDKPQVIGSFWGEVNANVHRALGCVGTITDGAIRDLDEMNNAGFKAIARRLCVGHAHVVPVRWGVEIQAFGRVVQPGQLIHADKHGFLIIPEEDEQDILEASRFMDQSECDTVISAARSSVGKSNKEIISNLLQASKEFRKQVRDRYGKQGEI